MKHGLEKQIPSHHLERGRSGGLPNPDFYIGPVIEAGRRDDTSSLEQTMREVREEAETAQAPDTATS